MERLAQMLISDLAAAMHIPNLGNIKFKGCFLFLLVDKNLALGI